MQKDLSGCLGVPQWGGRTRVGPAESTAHPPVEAGQTCLDTRSEAVRTVTQEGWAAGHSPFISSPPASLHRPPTSMAPTGPRHVPSEDGNGGGCGQKAVTY